MYKTYHRGLFLFRISTGNICFSVNDRSSGKKAPDRFSAKPLADCICPTNASFLSLVSYQNKSSSTSSSESESDAVDSASVIQEASSNSGCLVARQERTVLQWAWSIIGSFCILIQRTNLQSFSQLLSIVRVLPFFATGFYELNQ